MLNERMGSLKTSATNEARQLLRIFAYIWAVLILLSFHRALILHDDHLISHQGLAFINALALAKVVLLGQNLPLIDCLRERPLIYPILFKSALFAAILFCFHVIEETIIGMVHGKTLSRSIPDIGGGTLQGILMIEIITFVMLIPFFAFMELERIIGPEELSRLLFGRRGRDAP
jgi:hypothetical protein